VKNLSTEEIHGIEAQILLSNTYHLYLKPGEKLIEKFGGLHKFMNWDKPILTDSGGYQVFSLAGNKGGKDKLVKITDDGVHFTSHLDGSKHFFKPETSIQIQQRLGVDIMMAFDVCPPLPSSDEVVLDAVEKTTQWAERCKKEWKKGKYGKKWQMLFGIVQGGTNKELRIKSAQELSNLDFSGYAVGGLAVGEARNDMFNVLDYITEYLPEEKPRYLMGVGKPEEIVYAVSKGIDMFDCVIPTREARHGRLYMFCNKKDEGSIHLFGKIYYKTINVGNMKYTTDKKIINKKSKNNLLKTLTFGYLHHLLKTKEGLGYRIATIQNLEFYLELMSEIREGIDKSEI